MQDFWVKCFNLHAIDIVHYVAFYMYIDLSEKYLHLFFFYWTLNFDFEVLV